jgi:predicted DNA-binding transcriptional regulator AlpA
VSNKKPKIPPVETQKFKPAIDVVADEAALAAATSRPLRMIDKRQLLERVPISYATVWKWMQNGRFPRSRNLGGKTGWIECEVDNWINARPLAPIKGDNKVTSS